MFLRLRCFSHNSYLTCAAPASPLSAARTTSPTTPTETCKRSAHAPSWCSRAITPATRSGWATQRHPRCGTTTRCAPTGGAPTRRWRARRQRLTCCRVATGTSCSSAAPSGGGGRGQGREGAAETKSCKPEILMCRCALVGGASSCSHSFHVLTNRHAWTCTATSGGTSTRLSLHRLLKWCQTLAFFV